MKLVGIESVWESYGSSQARCQALSCQQWYFCSKRFPWWSQQKSPENHILCCRCASYWKQNKMLTLSAKTLLLHSICMWLHMIDTMFWPFSFKAVAERHNCLSLNSNGLTPNPILHDVLLDVIPVKTFHTLFCPGYVLDTWTQSAGGPASPCGSP